MAVPSFHAFLDPLLRVLAAVPAGLTTSDAQLRVAEHIGLSAEDRALRVPSGTQLLFRHRTNWAHDRLKRAGLSWSPRRGVWQATTAGQSLALECPAALSLEDVRALAKVGRDVRIANLATMGDRPSFRFTRARPSGASAEVSALDELSRSNAKSA